MEQDSEKFLKSLVSKAKEGDRAAYGKIFRSCYADIYDYISYRIHLPSDYLLSVLLWEVLPA